jgi:hypothetical protein
MMLHEYQRKRRTSQLAMEKSAFGDRFGEMSRSTLSIKINISLSLLYLSLNLSAQQFNVTFSELKEKARRSTNYALPGGGFVGVSYVEDDGLLYNWKRKEKISILLFDANMNLVKQYDMANGQRAFGTIYTSFQKFGNEFWLLYSEPSSKDNYGDLKISPTTLEAGTPKTVLALSSDHNLKPGVFTPFDIRVKMSPNGKHSCLFVSNGKKNGVLCALDEELNVLWTKNDIPADIGIKPEEINCVEIDNQGNVYVGYAKDALGHVAVYKSANAPHILDVSIENGKPNDVVVLAHKNNSSITIAGGYFENSENIRGVFKAVIDVSFKVNNITKTPFSDTLVKLFHMDSWGSTKPNKFGIEPNYLAQLFEVDSNIVDLVIEIKHGIYSQDVGSIIHSGNILNVCFRNGEVSFTRIPRYELTTAPAWNNYYALPFEHKMIIFYNDNPYNLTKDINASPKLVNVQENSVLVAAVVGPDGSVQRRTPIDVQDNYMGVAEWMHSAAEGRVQVPIYGLKKKFCYATISIK